MVQDKTGRLSKWIFQDVHILETNTVILCMDVILAADRKTRMDFGTGVLDHKPQGPRRRLNPVRDHQERAFIELKALATALYPRQSQGRERLPRLLLLRQARVRLPRPPCRFCLEQKPPPAGLCSARCPSTDGEQGCDARC